MMNSMFQMLGNTYNRRGEIPIEHLPKRAQANAFRGLAITGAQEPLALENAAPVAAEGAIVAAPAGPGAELPSDGEESGHANDGGIDSMIDGVNLALVSKAALSAVAAKKKRDAAVAAAADKRTRDDADPSKSTPPAKKAKKSTKIESAASVAAKTKPIVTKATASAKSKATAATAAKSKLTAKKANASAKSTGKKSTAPTSFSHISARSCIEARLGRKGPGSSATFTYKKYGSAMKAEQAAKAWLRKAVA
jgi:hypothetical protein